MRAWCEPSTLPASHTGRPAPGDPRGAGRGGRRAVGTLAGAVATLAGGLTELAWIGAHAVVYPLGTWAEHLSPDVRVRPAELAPTARALFAEDPLAARIPVLLVHGMVDNRSVFTLLQRSLRRRGFTQVCSWNYTPLLTDVARAAAQLGAHIERICQQTGHEQLHVVGHSLGGLIARYHVQRQGGARRVASLVTLGTPHQGSIWAHAVPTPLIRQLRPGSPLLRELAEPAPGCATRVTAIYSNLDEMIVPTRSGRCDHPDLQARNVLVRGVGHMALPIHRGVAGEVAATLAGRRAMPPAVQPAAAVA